MPRGLPSMPLGTPCSVAICYFRHRFALLVGSCVHHAKCRRCQLPGNPIYICRSNSARNNVAIMRRLTLHVAWWLFPGQPCLRFCLRSTSILRATCKHFEHFLRLQHEASDLRLGPSHGHMATRSQRAIPETTVSELDKFQCVQENIRRDCQ